MNQRYARLTSSSLQVFRIELIPNTLSITIILTRTTGSILGRHLDEINANNMARVLTEEAMKQGAGIVVTSIGKHLELDYTKKMLL